MEKSELISRVDVCLQNIGNFLDDPSSFGLLTSKDISDVSLVNAVFSLDDCYEISKNVGYFDAFNFGLSTILEKCFSNMNKNVADNSKEISLLFVITMISYAGSNGKIWFFEAVRDDIMEWEMRYHGETIVIFWLITIYLYYLARQEDMISDAYKHIFSDFIDGQPGIKNGFILVPWSELVRRRASDIQPNNSFLLLKEILDLYESKKKKDGPLAWYSPTVKEFEVFSSDKFNKKLIINSWLTFLLNGGHSYSSYAFKDDISKCFNGESVIDFVNLFDSNNRFLSVADHSLLDFYHIRPAGDSYISESDLYKSLVNFKNSLTKKDLDDEMKFLKAKNISQTENEQKLSAILADAVKEMGFKEANKQSAYYKKVVIESYLDLFYGLDDFFKNIKNDVEAGIKRMAYNDFLNSGFYKNSNPFGKTFTNEDINVMKSLMEKGKCFASNTIFSDELPKNLSQKDVEDLTSVSVNQALFLPTFVFYLKSGINVCLNVSSQGVCMRKFDSSSLVKFVDQRFKQKDGTYLFKRYGNDSRSVFLSKEEILSVVEDRFLYYKIVFDYEFHINESQVFARKAVL